MDPDKNGADKRDREKVFTRMETEVEKASRRLRVVSMGIACKVAADRNITKVDIALPNIPNSPLETFWRENNVFLKGLEAAMRSTQLQLNMLRIYKAKGDWEAFVRHLKIDLEEEEEEAKGFEEEEHADLTPVVPILQMNVDEVSAFFSNLMKRLLQMGAGGGKPGRLWAGKRQPAGRIDDGFTLIVDDKLCFWKIEYSLQAPSTSTTRQPT